MNGLAHFVMKSSRVLLVEIAVDCVGQRLDIGLGLGGVGEILSMMHRIKSLRGALYIMAASFSTVSSSPVLLATVRRRCQGFRQEFCFDVPAVSEAYTSVRVGERFTIIVNLPVEAFRSRSRKYSCRHLYYLPGAYGPYECLYSRVPHRKSLQQPCRQRNRRR